MSEGCTRNDFRGVIDGSTSIHYKNIVIVNDTSRVIRMTPQLGASRMIVILTNLEVSFMIKIFFIIYAPRDVNYASKTTYSIVFSQYFYNIGHWSVLNQA